MFSPELGARARERSLALLDHKAGKVPVQKVIQHKGKSITVTYWVKAPDSGKGDKESKKAAPAAAAPAEAPKPAATKAEPAAAPPAAQVTKTVDVGGKSFGVTYHVEPGGAAAAPAPAEAPKPAAPAAAAAAPAAPPAAAPAAGGGTVTKMVTVNGKTFAVKYHVGKKGAKQPKAEAKPGEAKPTEAKPASAPKPAQAAPAQTVPAGTIAIPAHPGRDAAAIRERVSKGSLEDVYKEIGEQHSPEIAKVAAEAVSRWAGSSTNEPSLKLRGAVAPDLDAEADHIAAVTFRKGGSMDKDTYRKHVRSMLEKSSQDPKLKAAIEGIATVSQAMHPEEMVTLYRGIGHKQAGHAKATRELATGALVSFTERKSVAMKFASGGKGVVVKVQVPRSAIVMSHRALEKPGQYGHGSLLHGEAEVVVATSGKLQNVAVLGHHETLSNKRTRARAHALPFKWRMAP